MIVNRAPALTGLTGMA